MNHNYMRNTAACFVLLICAGMYLSAQPFFHKRINEPVQMTNWLFAAPNNNGIILQGYDGFFTTYAQISDQGDTLWTRRYMYEANVALENSIPVVLPDGTMEHIMWDSARIHFWKTNQLNFVSGKSFLYDTAYFHPWSSYISFGKKLSNQSTAVAGASMIITGGGFSMDQAAILTIIDDQMNILWSNYYYVSGFVLHPAYIAEKTDRYILMGSTITFGPPSSTDMLFALHIDKSTGNIIGQAEIYQVSGDIVITSISDNGKYASGYHFDIMNPTSGIVLKINDSGSPLVEWGKKINVNNFPYTSINLVQQYGNDLFIGGKAGKLNAFGGWDEAQYYFAKADENLNSFSWSKVYSDTLFSGEMENEGCAFISKDLGSSILTCGEFSNVLGLGYLFNVRKSDGFSACKDIAVTSSSSAFTLVPTYHTVSTQSGIFHTQQPLVLPTDLAEAPILNQLSTVCFNTSVEQINTDRIQVYPNPVFDMLHISMDEKQPYCIIISNPQGKHVLDVQSPVSAIDVSGLAPGVYILCVITENRKYHTKFLKF